MPRPYHRFETLIEMIDEPNRTRCRKLFDDNRDVLTRARGSKSKHQAWEGGYIHHLEEAMNLGIILCQVLGGLRHEPFSLSDVLLVLFLHDLEKPWKYIEGVESQEFVSALADKSSQARFRMDLIDKYGIALSEDHCNALRYVEGEGKDWDPDERKMGSLAALCHMCDVGSARYWPNQPVTPGRW